MNRNSQLGTQQSTVISRQSTVAPSLWSFSLRCHRSSALAELDLSLRQFAARAGPAARQTAHARETLIMTSRSRRPGFGQIDPGEGYYIKVKTPTID